MEVGGRVTSQRVSEPQANRFLFFASCLSQRKYLLINNLIPGVFLTLHKCTMANENLLFKPIKMNSLSVPTHFIIHGVGFGGSGFKSYTPLKNDSWKTIDYMGVFKNNGTPKSSSLVGFSIINHLFWGTPILETPI